ncbi:hypothetical protein CIHG_03555 [Coccidioides immitis H538.4]|uniref:Uncharacterized protein n=1 Tax=Coccidioides immitis H538.4 TaxID=396776 RepID=A0A0J8RPV2_COCIT|nr:hypothetical protein CIHG_03555 [Coccidioides immitis H538.4]
MARLLCDVDQIDCSDTGGEERLVGVAPCGVHDQAALVGTDGLGERGGTLLVEDLLPPLLAGDGDVDGCSGLVDDGGHADGALELGLADLALDPAAVDGNVAEVGEELLGAVLAADEGEELGGVVDEGGPAGALDECRVVRGDDGAGEAVSAVETDAVAAGGAVDLDLAGVGLEALCGIFGGDAALDGEASGGDAVLGEAELLEGGAGGDLDLGGDDVDAGDLLGDGVLDLDAGFDLDEVVAVELVDEELGGAGVAVADGLGQLDGVGEDAVADVDGEVLGRGELDDLLVAALGRCSHARRGDDVAVFVAEQLDLDVLGLSRSARRRRCRCRRRIWPPRCALEGVAEGLLVADDTHAAATAAEGGLDDDGEAVLVGEGLDLLEAGDGALGPGDDGDAALDGEATGGDLVAQGVDGVRRGADEDEAGLLDVAGELSVLGEEAVARVDEVDAVLDGDADDLVAGEIGADGGELAPPADHVGLVRLLAVHAEAVLVGVDGDGLEGQLVGGAEDADGDLAAVGDEDLVELHDGGVCAQSAVDGVLVVGGGVVLDDVVDRLLGHDGNGWIGGSHGAMVRTKKRGEGSFREVRR